MAKVIQTKAQSIRNKSGKGLYKAKIKISRADAEHPNFKRLMSLGLAAAGCVQIVDDLPPMLTADEDGELTVAADFESMAEEKLVGIRSQHDPSCLMTLWCNHTDPRV